jgi:virulence factor Mce-like protein
MKIDRRLAINLVSVLLLGLVMVGWVISQVVGSALFSDKMEVTVDFANTGGVFTDQEVTYRGVLVGRVGELTLTEDGVLVKLLIDSEWTGRIPSDVLANVRSKSAVGEQFVNLTPTGSGTDTLEDGDTIPRDDTSLPVDFQELLKSLDRVLGDVPADATNSLVTSLDEGVSESSEDIKVILESLGKLSRAFSDVAAEQVSLLDSSTEAGAAFLRTKDEFVAAIKAADTVFTGIGDEPEELKEFFGQSDRLARSGIRFITKYRRNLVKGIDELLDFTQFQKVNQNELIVKSLEYVPAFLKAIEDSSIPWENPDGSKFYRLRIGLILDNVEASWPCKYAKLPVGYERFHFERDKRRVPIPKSCQPPPPRTAADFTDSLVEWAQSTPTEPAPGLPKGIDARIEDQETSLMWPIQGPIASPFGERDGRMHDGIDIDATTGDPVRAAAAGRVVQAGYYNGYGNSILVDHGDGMTTMYAHLSALGVTVGEEIEQGYVIGLVGCTGSCTGDHLHFEVRLGGTPVDPLLYLPGGRLYQGSSSSSSSSHSLVE